jgi:hypothetical protein
VTIARWIGRIAAWRSVGSGAPYRSAPHGPERAEPDHAPSWCARPFSAIAADVALALARGGWIGAGLRRYRALADSRVGPQPVRLRRPPEPIVRTAIVETPYRYALARDWGTGKRLLICGCNPSNADGKRDDPTLWRATSFAYSLGFSSLVMVNVFPFIASKPADLTAWLAGNERGQIKAIRKNRATVAMAAMAADTCLAAWGNLVGPGYLAAFLEGLGKVRWHCLGRTGSKECDRLRAQRNRAARQSASRQPSGNIRPDPE